MKEINEEALKDITGGLDVIECLQQQNCKDYTDPDLITNCISKCMNDPNVKPNQKTFYKVIESPNKNDITNIK